MVKRFALLIVLAGFLAGCQSPLPVQPGETAPTDVQEQAVEDEVVAVVQEKVEEEAVEPEVQEPVAKEADKPAVQETAVHPTTTPPVEVVETSLTQMVQPKEQKRNKIMILMKTSEGDIKIELDKEKAPKTVENFLSYVEEGHYAGTIFHRIINGFMIQGGGFDENMNQKSAPRTVENEAANGLKNEAGSIAMARTPAPHSASAQFFINVNDNAFLDYPGQDGWGYCVFGKVVEGMDVVNAIKSVPTGITKGMNDVPKEAIIIHSVETIDE